MTEMNAVTAVPPRESHPGRLAPRWWQAAAAGAALATVINLLILLAARAADASLVLREPGAADHPITAGGVIFSSVVPMTGGILLATLLARRWPGVLRLAQLVGGGLALLTVAGPLTSGTDGVTRTALVAMHLVVGVTVVLALEAIRRRRPDPAGGGIR